MATPIRRDVTFYQDFTGRTASVQRAEVRARVPGFLERMNFVPGDFVKKGQLLFLIEPEPYQAQRDQADAAAQVRRGQPGPGPVRPGAAGRGHQDQRGEPAGRHPGPGRAVPGRGGGAQLGRPAGPGEDPAPVHRGALAGRGQGRPEPRRPRQPRGPGRGDPADHRRPDGPPLGLLRPPRDHRSPVPRRPAGDGCPQRPGPGGRGDPRGRQVLRRHARWRKASPTRGTSTSSRTPSTPPPAPSRREGVVPNEDQLLLARRLRPGPGPRPPDAGLHRWCRSGPSGPTWAAST